MLRASRFRINYFYQFDRLVKIDYPDMPNVVLQYGAAGALYNAAGRITHVTDQSGITDYQYGKLGETVAEKRQLQSLTGDSRLVSFENDFRYDYLGRMEWMRYPDGEELTYTYDRGGEVKAVTGVKHSHNRTYVAQISYDEFGQRVYLKYGNGVTTNYSYDPNRRWLKEIDTTEKGGKALQRSAYLFDLVGNVSSVTNTAYKTVSQTYSYDDLYQLVGAKGTYTPHEKRRSDIYQQAFAYDDIGNMVEKTSTHQWTSASDDPDGLQYARAYKYDTDRPHTAVRVGGWTYQYDLNGNLLWRGLDDRSREVYDGPGEGHQGGDWLKHDTAGGSSSSSDERSLVATQHADEGRDNDHDRGWGEAYKWGFKHWRDPPVGERVQQYSWDSENRLRVAQQEGQSVKFLYDREGNRTVKKGARGETLYVDRYYQVQNRDEAAKHIFVGDTRIATRLSDYDHDDWSYEEASLYYYHPDHLGSTTFVTDRDGDEYQHLEYTPYGESWIDEGSNKHLVGYRFTGKELDEETGLYYFGARYLDPQVSIWLSADPAMGKYMPETPVNEEARKRNGNLPGMGGVFNPINMAVYHYAGNNPVKYVDPSGQATWIKIQGENWWFYFEQAKGGDPAHFHFLQGKDPRSSRALVYARRVSVTKNEKGDIDITQKPHGGGKGGNVDKDVPEEIVKKAVNQKGGDQKVSLSEPLFGLLGVENLTPTKETVRPGDEGYPSGAGSLGPITMSFSVTRDKETGAMQWTMTSAIDEMTGRDVSGILFMAVPHIGAELPQGAQGAVGLRLLLE